MKAHRYLPTILMGVVAAIPLVTAGEILAHMGKSVAALPPVPKPGSRSSGTASQPTTTAKTAPTPQPTSTARTGHSSINGTFQGGSYPDLFGYLSSSVTVRNGRIVGVSISAPMDNPQSAFINSQAVPLLKSETLQAQSANINVVSGATATSEAYYYSLSGALSKAGL